MLGGIAPIILFEFGVEIPSIIQKQTQNNVSVATQDKVKAISYYPPIPIYLDPQLTGLHIDTEDKNIDVETSIDTYQKPEKEGDPFYYQRGLSSTVTVNLLAQKDSIGVVLLSAMFDLIFPKVTAREYRVTYLHGAITIFGGLVRAFYCSQDQDTDLYKIKIEFIKGSKEKILPFPQVANLPPGKAVIPNGRYDLL